MTACVSSALLLLSMFTAHDSDTSTDEMATEATEAQSESESTDMLIGTEVGARFVG